MRQLRPNETHDVACRDVGCDMCEGECDDGDRTWTYQRKCAAVATCEMTQQRQSPVKFRQISVKFRQNFAREFDASHSGAKADGARTKGGRGDVRI